MIRQASATMAAFASAGDRPRGLQRRQARKPAASASAGVSKKDTLRGFARREGQDGRQYTPEVFTA
jgi:hypothetical protein